MQPSADHVPANLLRISLVFPAPVEGGVLSGWRSRVPRATASTAGSDR